MIDSDNERWGDSLTGNAGGETDREPAAIEADIRRTQDEMSRTVDRIGDQLTPRSIMNALFDKAEGNNIDARMLLDGARRNPLALAMIAGGVLWLISDRDANLPKKQARTRDDDHWDSDHRDEGHEAKSSDRHRDDHDNSIDYVAHMNRVEWRDGEDEASFRRRRDIARSNFFMIERGHDEDEGSFRKRLDEAAEKFRETRQAVAEKARGAGSRLRGAGEGMAGSVRKAGDAVRERSASVADQAKRAGGMLWERSAGMAGQATHLYDDHPVIGGLLAATAGAALATTLPVTRMEAEQLGDIGQRARGMFDQEKDKLMGAARARKDEVLHKAEDAVNPPEPAAS